MLPSLALHTPLGKVLRDRMKAWPEPNDASFTNEDPRNFQVLRKIASKQLHYHGLRAESIPAAWRAIILWEPALLVKKCKKLRHKVMV